MSVVNVRPGETVTVVGLPAVDPNAPRPSHPIMLPGMPGWGSGGPVDPGYSPPWAQVPPGGQGGGPVDPGYSPPWAQVRPPVDPGYSPPWAQVRPPVDPGYSPPWAQLPEVPPTEPPPVQPPPTGGSGHWVWAWSPQAGRWVWVRVPGEGEMAPKA
jgi:hypothetical protein